MIKIGFLAVFDTHRSKDYVLVTSSSIWFRFFLYQNIDPTPSNPVQNLSRLTSKIKELYKVKVENIALGTEVCSLLEWSFIISLGVSSDPSQFIYTGFAGSH